MLIAKYKFQLIEKKSIQEHLKQNYITDEKINTTTNGSSSTSYTTTVTEPIILNSSGSSVPLVLTEKLPKVKGVVVVAEGANDVSLKLNIIQAIKTLIDIPSGNIQVFAG